MLEVIYMENLKINYLENNDENIKIVSNLILKDISEKCFCNKDLEGNIISIEDMAIIYLEYTKMYGIKYLDLYIGLLSLTNENEISIFIEPDYQNRGIGQYCLILFEKMLKEQYGLQSLIAETTLDNIECIKLLNKNGFESTNETREVPINNVPTKVAKYIKKL